jgi:hypothetical protein
VAVTLPPASISASTTARSPLDSTTFARRWIGTSVGVGRLSLTWNSAVTVHGGVEAPLARIRCHAAVQLLWQSRSAPTMPPLSIPGNASWCFSARHSATTTSPSTKLLMRRPFALAGPQPKHALCGA